MSCMLSLQGIYGNYGTLKTGNGTNWVIWEDLRLYDLNFFFCFVVLTLARGTQRHEQKGAFLGAGRLHRLLDGGIRNKKK